MARQIRQAVPITGEQWEFYQEQFRQGKTILPAVRAAQERFHLPVAHTREAVRQKCIREGISFPRGRVDRVRAATTALDIKPKTKVDGYQLEQMIKVFNDAEAAIEKAKTEIMTEALKKLDIPTMIDAFQKAMLYPEARQDADYYRRGYENLREAKETEIAERVARQQGDRPKPLTS